MRRIHKKGSIEYLNSAMLGFVGFVLVIMLAVLFVSTIKGTSIVCPSSDDNGQPVRYYNGACQVCPTGYSVFNTTGNTCCNTSVTHCYSTNATNPVEYGGMAYNGTKDLQDASLLPPQFASLIVIVVIITGIIALLALIGYTTYNRMNN